MALPDGLRVMEPLTPPASFQKKEGGEEARQTFIVEAIAQGKRQVAAALERYQQEA